MAHAAYVFDAYGTLFDVHAAVRKHAEKLGPDVKRKTEWQHTSMRGPVEIFKKFVTLPNLSSYFFVIFVI